ncbi:SDR family NAD(P)-dependent oxidoreductase [Thermoleophilia bacterium SCSIO 60948]|nr:SDR family NAD(P)-dependent oxidoreductase [Thermoleophilia bacterium SCSIO 60948]
MDALAGRTIVITGVGGGLGPAVAERFAAEGANLAVCDRTAELALAAVDGLGLPEERLMASEVDLLDADATRAWAGEIEARFGRADALLHLVGGWRGGDPLPTAPMEDYEWLHDLLVRTTQHVTRAFHDQLAASDHGRFAIVSSSQAAKPAGTNAAYGATKAAAEAWTLALADSFREADSAATANILVVNAIVTPKMREESPDKPFKTFTSTEDIADGLAYLCSDAAAKMNGQRLSLHR